jgi:hypothetical protein
MSLNGESHHHSKYSFGEKMFASLEIREGKLTKRTSSDTSSIPISPPIKRNPLSKYSEDWT